MSNTLLNRAKENPQIMFDFSPREFERMVCELLDRQGYKVISVDCINRLGNYNAYYSTGFGGISKMPGGCSMNLAM